MADLVETGARNRWRGWHGHAPLRGRALSEANHGHPTTGGRATPLRSARNSTRRGGSPDPPRRNQAAQARRRTYAAGQVADSLWRETRRAKWRWSTIFASLALAAIALGFSGCGKSEKPDGTPRDWLDEARRLEERGAWFQEHRPGAPLGALEHYRLCLEAEPAAANREEIQEKVDWFEALRLVMEDAGRGKADYAAAIQAMTAFRQQHPRSPEYAMALFYRALAKEYDTDRPDLAGAIDDYRLFVKENPGHDLVPEVYIRIGHCYCFDLDKPDYDKAVAVYDELIQAYGPTDEAVAKAPAIVRLAVERALYNKAQILDSRGTQGLSADAARPFYERAAQCYERLTHNVFFDQARFRKFQFVHYRLGCILAENLGRKKEGLAVLCHMTARWRESPWYGRVIAKLETLTGENLHEDPDGNLKMTVEDLLKKVAAMPEREAGAPR